MTRVAKKLNGVERESNQNKGGSGKPGKGKGRERKKNLRRPMISYLSSVQRD